MKWSVVALGLLASSVSGHIQMSNPYPLRSPLNKDGSGQKDYSYTNPLSTDGSDYPCKGYAKDEFKSVANYSPGQEYDLELQGSATHNGGSCQIGLSYDQGKTFRVIHSMLGECPQAKKYKFKIPQDAKSGQALLSWSWFNKVGNREMYMNCAQVTIGGGHSKREQSTRSLIRRGGFDSLPEIFQANNNGPGKCRTIEGQAVKFPQPGSSVQGEAGGDKGYECEGSAPFLGSSRSAKTSSNSTSSSAAPSSSHAHMISSSGVASSAAPSSASPSSSHGPKTHDTHGPARYPFLNSIANGFAHMFHAAGCVDGTIICEPNGLSWSMCDHGAPHFMGAVAPGTICRHGRMYAL
ncbi:hypothetical protein P168DRAFT_332918 [Aspergillus campestris IBT 28561]|uniref:Extracellular protein n=1 Tax=Aspergillus campestris (strain IBT 28561) TaxID=1392248 RepID=A0A2I1DHF7_ASPC2|nr:uncharacterized protein P168DRAFT_332918 [Aspergillus campestris IBT 28561]PKY09301.1 hypothetical protein P168DRAFT_332918 [Aspergillus campestris IBT 28561]